MKSDLPHSRNPFPRKVVEGEVQWKIWIGMSRILTLRASQR
jgi:hypothetical protein